MDIYSCFPCAVETVCEVIGLPIDGSKTLTVTGGLPFFGGPGNNYSMHALAEMVVRLRGTTQRALVTVNGGLLSKHAAAVLSNMPTAEGGMPLDLRDNDPVKIAYDTIPAVPLCDEPEGGEIISYTVIHQRTNADLAIVLGQTEQGERFLARSDDPGTVANMQQSGPIGRRMTVNGTASGNLFTLVS